MKNDLSGFKNKLIDDEKSYNTIYKYLHDVDCFLDYADGRKMTKRLFLEYKEHISPLYLPKSVNTVIASINAYMVYIGKPELKIKYEKIQKPCFRDVSKELTRDEYYRLVYAAKSSNKIKTALILETLASTGIRVSELEFLTVESIKCRMMNIKLKGKIRVVLLPDKLNDLLSEYIKDNNITSGPVFLTKNGTTLSRINLWRQFKNLCKTAQVDQSKVYPHNFRHLFAVSYYDKTKDIVHLSDILGHSSVNTTRIYTQTSVETFKNEINSLNLVV